MECIWWIVVYTVGVDYIVIIVSEQRDCERISYPNNANINTEILDPATTVTILHFPHRQNSNQKEPNLCFRPTSLYSHTAVRTVSVQRK